jgi:hypothetical protein
MRRQICPFFRAANRASVARNPIAARRACVTESAAPLQLTQM